MTHKLRWLLVAGTMAFLAASAAACGDDETEPTEQPTRCDDVVCGDDPNVACDPADGIYKCGFPEHAGAVACGPGQLCTVDPAPACTSGLCDLVTCTGGQACDPGDGLCKCGSAPCGEGEQCVQNTCVASNLCVGVTCGASEACDPADGLCKCGGAICTFGQSCQDGACTDDACAGVNCGPGTECNPDDGLCHCGGVDGDVCTTGQACVDDGTTAYCDGVDLCENASIRCQGGTVCDPADGQCRCGGVGPTAPICGAGQTCDATLDQCLGGDQCTQPDGNPVECGNGTSCDPENGLCKCGGLGGDTCGNQQVCVDISGAATCANPCSPIEQATCGEGAGCFFDPMQRSLGAFCATTGENPVPEGGNCSAVTECAPGLHCVAAADANRCRPYCDTSSETPCDDENRICVPLAGAPQNVGVCLTISAN